VVVSCVPPLSPFFFFPPFATGFLPVFCRRSRCFFSVFFFSPLRPKRPAVLLVLICGSRGMAGFFLPAAWIDREVSALLSCRPHPSSFFFFSFLPSPAHLVLCGQGPLSGASGKGNSGFFLLSFLLFPLFLFFFFPQAADIAVPGWQKKRASAGPSAFLFSFFLQWGKPRSHVFLA